MDKISMADLYKLKDRLGKNEVVLDVRTPEEYRDGHVPGSINIPHEEVTQHLGELKLYSKVYIHCKMGGRAQKASDALAQAGLTNLVCVAGSGMAAWIEAGYPVQKGGN
ncbi:MAG: rhodanese-like domain-containing protein [Bdellovibrionales bacterium]|nr:rhodanese-like domain-containing protein [Bdellovibrionales bacterium]